MRSWPPVQQVATLTLILSVESHTKLAISGNHMHIYWFLIIITVGHFFSQGKGEGAGCDFETYLDNSEMFSDFPNIWENMRPTFNLNLQFGFWKIIKNNVCSIARL